MDDFTHLTSPDHWLGWLGDDPAQMVRDAIERGLQKQVPTARLEWVHLIGDAKFLTGGKKIPDEPTKMIATRAGLAVEFELEVSSDEGTEQLSGVFSWAARGLDGERHDRTYCDLDVDMEWAAEILRSRIYDWDVLGSAVSGEEAKENSPMDAPPAPPKRSWQFWRKKP